MADIPVTLLDGRKVTVSVPDDMSEKDRQGAVQYAIQNEALKAKSAAAAQPQTGGDPIKRAVTAPVQGMNDAFAGVLGAPADIGSWVLRTAPKLAFWEDPADRARTVQRAEANFRDPIGGSAWWQRRQNDVATAPGRVADAVAQGSTAPLTEPRTARIAIDPNNDIEKYGYGAGRGAGDVLASLAGTGILSRVAPAGGTTQRVATQLTEQPAAQLATGAGGGAVAEKTGNPWWGLAASLGIGGGIGAAKSIGRAITEPLTEQGHQRIVGDFLAQNANRPAGQLADEIANAGRGSQVVPGSQPSTAELTRNAGLANIERSLRNEPRNVQAFYDRDAARNAARQAVLDEIGPGSPGSPVVSGAVRRAYENYVAQSGTPIAGAERRAAQTVQDVGTGQPPDIAGGTIRQSFEDAASGQTGMTNAAYDAARRAATDVKVGTKDLTAALRAEMDRIYPTGVIEQPAYIKNAIRELEGEAGYVPGYASKQTPYKSTLDKIEDLKKVVQRAAPTEGTDAHASNRFTQIVDNFLKEPPSNATPEQAQAFLEARATRNLEGQRFTDKGTAGFNEPLTRREYGKPTLRDPAIPANYFRPGEAGQTAMRQFMSVMGNDPAAVDAIGQHARAQFVQAAVRNGRIDVPAAEAWLRNHGGALQSLPQVGQQIGDAVEAQRFLEAASATRARGLTDLTNSVVGQIARGNPAHAFDAIMAADNPVRAAGAVRFEIAGNGRAQEALKRAAVEWVQRQSRPGLGTEAVGGSVSPARFANVTAAEPRSGVALERVLRAAGLSQQEIANIGNVRQDILSSSFAQNAGRSIGSNTIQNALSQRMVDQLTMGIPVSMIPRAREVAAPLTNFFARPGGQLDSIRDLATQAALNPMTAEEVLRATAQRPATLQPWRYPIGAPPFVDYETQRK